MNCCCRFRWSRFEYPDNDRGPQTLLTSLTTEQNIDRLYWLMSRFQGYVGLVNYMGARFTASEQGLAPVLRDVAKRGLIYVDGASPVRSPAQTICLLQRRMSYWTQFLLRLKSTAHWLALK
jgi:polysaccharide deacetylase 2 family uncharacterized protein YibQ